MRHELNTNEADLARPLLSDVNHPTETIEQLIPHDVMGVIADFMSPEERVRLRESVAKEPGSWSVEAERQTNLIAAIRECDDALITVEREQLRAQLDDVVSEKKGAYIAIPLCAMCAIMQLPCNVVWPVSWVLFNCVGVFCCSKEEAAHCLCDDISPIAPMEQRAWRDAQRPIRRGEQPASDVCGIFSMWDTPCVATWVAVKYGMFQKTKERELRTRLEQLEPPSMR